MKDDFPRAVIFDWDNTLVDSWGAIGGAMNHVRQSFGEPTWSPDQIKQNCVRSAREIFPEWYGERWKQANDLFYSRFTEIRRTAPLQILPGSQDTLDLLKAQHIPMFIVSNRHGPQLRQEVANLGWHEYFQGVVGAQDAKADKPSRAPVDLALSHGDLTAGSDIWFVGDSEVDVVCATNAGCTAVYVGNMENATRLSVARVFAGCHQLHAWLYGCSNKALKK